DTFIELHCHSHYSFRDGASSPEELALQALALGYPALALTDHDGLYGSMVFAQFAARHGLQAITGAEVRVARPPQPPNPGGSPGGAARVSWARTAGRDATHN